MKAAGSTIRLEHVGHCPWIADSVNARPCPLKTADLIFSPKLELSRLNRGSGGWAKMDKNKKISWYPAQKKPGLGWMDQTPRAGTGDSVGWFRRYHWSTLTNYDSNLSMCGTFLKSLLPPPDIHELLSASKEAYDLNLSAVTWDFGHLEPQHRFFVPKNCLVQKRVREALGAGSTETWNAER